ncbi:MAG: phosphate regulon sensor histidine kinase PhoR [Woeseiaceae bacterium]|nr:phosphate regulon sensor histidine kinase PhoR [Woeseiaceae bacterium]
MPESSRKLLSGLALLLGAGLGIGWLYSQPLTGLLVAALAALAWQVRWLVGFDRALHTRDFRLFQHGDGIWQRIYSRLAFERDRARRHKREYRRLLKEFRKSTDAMPDGAVILNEDNEIVACNRAATVLAGLKRKKDRGQRVDNIIRDPTLARLLHAEGELPGVDIPSPAEDGHWLNCRVVPFGAGQKLLLLRDVTERIALNRMRRDFVANASHELRSPLTVISGYLDSIADDPDLAPELGKPVAEMQAQARRMTTIIGELLELSRLESAGRRGEEDVIDIAALLAECRKAYARDDEAPGITIEAGSTAKLRGRRDEIDSLVRNLLSNAVRHTPADGVVTLSWQAGPDGAELVVRDTGEGIAAEHIPRLTERFFRVDRGRAREDGGVGLGLAIVKHVLSRHDGELDVTSTVGEGSEFRCRFPASRVEAGRPIPLASGAEGA